MLLANKADVNARNNRGYTPLNTAAYYGYKDVAELLLANGANVDAMNSLCISPLHSATVRGHKDVADMLREHGGHDIGSQFCAREWNFP